MSIRITHVRYGSTPKTEQTISRYRWRNIQSGAEDSSDKQTLVSWIEGGGNACVGSGSNRVDVGVVNASPKYLRTYADGEWTNNLAGLPEF